MNRPPISNLEMLPVLAFVALAILALVMGTVGHSPRIDPQPPTAQEVR
jgi:hypothetical protein